MLGARLLWVLWSAAMVGVLVALAFEASYASAIADCAMDDRLVLCAGPLPDWLAPATLAAGALLTLLAARRLVRTTD